MTKRSLIIVVLMLGVLLLSLRVLAQPDRAAVMTVLTSGVQVQRVNTAASIPIETESIVGVGDLISTGAQGEARITFMDGMTTDLQPNTQYRIEQFIGSDNIFSLTVEVLRGRTSQRIQNELNRNSSYRVRTPGMTLGARGTEFEIRVESSGRTGVIVTDGTVDVEKLDATRSIAPGFGVRAAMRGELSDVVRADNFAQLDSAIDGCTVSVATPDDVSINVRLGPSVEQPRVGGAAASEIRIALGVSTSGNWYRLAYRGGAGWFLSTNLQVVGQCAGLRVFPDDHAEDPDAFTQPLGFTPTLPGLGTAPGDSATSAEPETAPETGDPETIATPQAGT
jgi:hypothetical protein